MTDRALSLSHLRKTFLEISKLSANSQNVEGDPSKLLPLFSKVMEMYNPAELEKEFKDISNFLFYLTSFFVREVRHRATSQGTVEAATEIATFLQPSANSKGWAMLKSLNYLLCINEEKIIRSVVQSSFPTTLIKSLYLFLDLPNVPELCAQFEILEGAMFSILEKLCVHSIVIDDLVRKDDLLLLFAGGSSFVPPHNVIWRKTIARTLQLLSNKALNPLAISYIHNRNCIRLYLTNCGNEHLSTQEAVDMILCLLCILKDSSTHSNILLEDFLAANGYNLVKTFLTNPFNNFDIIRHFILMLTSLVSVGAEEINSTHSSGLVQLPTFVLPTPLGLDTSVRNLQAFKLLYEVYLNSELDNICSTVLDAIHSIYTSDPANYFILDKEYPLSLFVDHMHTKSKEVQLKVLDLVEHAVFQLNHIPCKELISFCIQIKTQLSAENLPLCISVVQSSFRLLTVDDIMKDAFREVGLLETACYALKNEYKMSKERDLSELETKFALLVTDLLTVMVKGNVENTKTFSEYVGPKTLLQLISDSSGDWRNSCFLLLKQLLLSSTTDQYLAEIIQVLNQGKPQEQLELDSHLLKCVLGVLRESHKVRVYFRKSGGYLSFISLFLALEDVFSNSEMNESDTEYFIALIDFVHLIFKVLSISMRFEPSNAKYFFSEVGWDSITTVLRLMGCFNKSQVIDVILPEWKKQVTEFKEELGACHSVFKMQDLNNSEKIPTGMPLSIFYACSMIRFLFNMAMDNYEKMTTDVLWSADTSFEGDIVSWSSSLLVHPGAVLSILGLLPSIKSDLNKWTVASQLYCSLLLKALLKPERNQQMMCQVDMPRHLLSISEKLFLCDDHVLLPSFYYLLERLSYQAMQPNQLRQFLRLDLPLCCHSLDVLDVQDSSRANEGGPVPLQRVRALVSMMTPKDQRLNHAPSFVEYDMSVEGFGCLFVPSLAPLYSTPRSERIFPPLNGLSFSTWLFIESFSDKKVDAHPLRLITISRTVAWQDERRKQGLSNLSCLSIQLSAIDKSLLISTEEFENAGADLEKISNFSSDKVIRVALADVVRPMEWFHLTVVLCRSVLKTSTALVYINGKLISTQKLQYIVQTAGGGATQLAQTLAVNTFLGTLPSIRRPSRLRYRIASTFLIEDALSIEIIACLYKLEPHYVGNFQTVGPGKTPLLAEEKVILSLNGLSTCELTLSKIRAVYSKIDSELLASHLGLSPLDNSTPLRIHLNTATHSPGPARSFGAVVVGYLGMRSFAPCPVPRLLDSMGGFACLYGLVAMASDSDGLYASLKALLSALRSNSNLKTALQSHRAYQTLAVLLEDKAQLLNSHIMHMIFSLAGTLDTSKETASIPNSQAFEDLLCDLDVWANAPDDVNRMILDHFYELITDHQRENLSTLRKSPLLSRLLFLLFEKEKISRSSNEIIFNLLAAILQPPSDSKSILKIGQMIAASLSSDYSNACQELKLPFHIAELQLEAFKTNPESSSIVMTYIRNRMLNILANFLSHSNPQLNHHLSEQIVKNLGFDWIFALLSPGVHSGTVFLALRILLAILSHSHLLNAFKEGSCNGGWLCDAEAIVRNRAAVVLGFSVSAHGGSVGGKIDMNPDLKNCPGFAALEHVMPAHCGKPHAFLAMLSILVGQPIKDLRFSDIFDIDHIWSHVYGLSPQNSVYEAISNTEFCFDAMIPLLSMIRAALYECNETDRTTAQGYGLSIIQMLGFMYQNSSNFFLAAHSEELFLAFFSCLIPNTNALGVYSAPSEPEIELADFRNFVSSNQLVKAALDLLKRILSNDFNVSGNGKELSLIDSIIDSFAEKGNTRRYQLVLYTVLVHECFTHLISTDLLVSSALPQNVTLQSLTQVSVNVSHFVSRVLDTQWNGNLLDSPKFLLNHLLSLHSIGNRSENKGFNLESIVASMMRCALFILSRPIDTVPVQMSVLDTLSLIVSSKHIFLSANEPWFFTSLTHLIFMLSVTPDIMCESFSPLDKASAQVALCAARVWTDVLCSRRSLLEDAFKKPIVSELNASRALLANSASVLWQQYVDSQVAPSMQNVSKDFQQQLTFKITKMATGLTRLAGKRTLSSAGSVIIGSPWKNISVDRNVIHMWLRVHISLIRELLQTQATRYHEWHAHVRKWSLQEWHQLEAELTRERGIWGPAKASKLDKYKLDTTEGTSRIRRKLIPNRLFYHIYPYRPHLDIPSAKAIRAKVAISKDSKLYYEACVLRRSRTMDSRIIDQAVTVTTPSEEQSPLYDLAQFNSSLIRRLSSHPSAVVENKGSDSETKDMGESIEEEHSVEKEPTPEEENTDDCSVNESQSIGRESEKERRESAKQKKRGPDNQTLLRLLEQGEQLCSMFRCARIQGLETSEGLLLFGKENFYVVDGFTLLKTREIRDLDFLSPELHDPIVPYTATGSTKPPKASRLCSKFSYEDIREVHKRRYLLQPIALELFSADGRNYLLAFPKKMRDRVYEKLLSMAKSKITIASESVGGQKASLAVEQSGRASILNSLLLGQQSVTQRWLNGQITNFQYLMHLNTLAGRSYNDLSQYPVFPWVLSDYTSSTLDLTNPETFRDFSKPMGAQSAQRLEQFLKRYREWDDPTGETPPYMYGTHYSSAMIVVSYLVRLEPFTQQFLSLQGGHFDLADRMFHSVGDAYVSASMNNMADVKELIPEFFTLPEMFQNKNNFDLGTKQNGVVLNDVILPPWAHGDPREFVRLHRQALECDYVSSHLNEWIDLVFGHKQTGEESIKANNLFHHLFYEGSVDFESIEDPLTRNATIGFVNNFGQIPTQLFKKPHPRKRVNPTDGFSNTPGVTTNRYFYHSLQSLKPPQSPTKEIRGSVGTLVHNDRVGLIVLEQNKVPLGLNRYIIWGLPDRSLRIGNIDSDKSTCIYEMGDSDELTCISVGDERTIFSGSTTGCISVWTLEKKPQCLKLRKVLDGHSDAVTAMVVCPLHAILVSASRDRSVIIWHQSELSLIRQLPQHPGTVSAVAVNETTGDIATACSSHLFLWSINGDKLADINTCDTNIPGDTGQMILSLVFTTINEWDSDNVVLCGTSDGVVKIYSCVFIKNDGSVEQNDTQSFVEVEPTPATTILYQRLEKQRKRLKMTSNQDSAISSTGSLSHSPEPPSSPRRSASHPAFVRVLVQRAALTMHTAFNRPDNTHPAPITSIIPSKDHRSLYVGDGIGRVWCWQIGDDGGRLDHWVQDVTRQRCTQCQQKFTIAERKHHCRNCGQIFCSKCSRFESHITHMKISRPVRVCQNCFVRLMTQNP
ncbi:unnamed protein product [Auanema sp. JU1783]|nr:unnamed protein product [Auanema sp. JU1783]